VKLAQLCISRTPLIAQCSTVSVIEALMVCARLGLEPNEPGGVWLVPFKNKDRYVCTSIVDYRGLIDVARRNTEIHAVHADLRYAADGWEFAIDTTSPTLVRVRHVPAEGERGDVLGAYFIVKLRHGECQAVYLTTDQIESYRGRSRGADSDYSPWKRDWAAMACKTACRRGVNLLPRTPEVQLLREVLAQEDRQPTPSQPISLVGELPTTDDTPAADQVEHA
jgi:recombination protein RecT